MIVIQLWEMASEHASHLNEDFLFFNLKSLLYEENTLKQ